jgi:hypothetical protein
MVKPRGKNGAKPAPRAQRKQSKNVQQQNQNAARVNGPKPSRQVGAAVITRFPKVGLSDVIKHRMSWIAGYTWVGDGTSGAVDNVFFETADGTNLMGYTAASYRGAAPILGGDSRLGASYVLALEKQFARKRIHRMWVHVVSLQPSTANNMMCVIGPSRAQGLAELSSCAAKATATAVQQTFTNVISMDDAMTVDSFESKTLDITGYIAGGSGARQNEFEISNNVSVATVLTTNGSPAQDLDGLVPACLTVSGNSTTAGLRGTRVHAIIVEQEVDLLDFLGGNTPVQAVGATPPTDPTAEITKMQQLAREFLSL